MGEAQTKPRGSKVRVKMFKDTIPILNIDDGSKHGFSFGVKKAKLIVENIGDINWFIDHYSAEEEDRN